MTTTPEGFKNTIYPPEPNRNLKPVHRAGGVSGDQMAKGTVIKHVTTVDLSNVYIVCVTAALPILGVVCLLSALLLSLCFFCRRRLTRSCYDHEDPE